MITATIQNGAYPHSQLINLTFPIDEEAMMEKLSEIGISDSNIASCHIVKISGKVPALCVLENSCINADEMNYLARRIDSFDNYELAKFQGAIAREGICTMKDLINLTFNLHNYTVVTDFSDLKNIGSKHYLDKNIGCPASEMEKLDFETMGRNLLSRGDGKITPYGVVFCNKLPIEEVYDGKMFPDYDYTSDYVFKLEVTRKDSASPSSEKVWLYLPASKACIVKALLRLGANTYNDLTFKCVDSSKLSEVFMERLSMTDNLGGVNELSKVIQQLELEEITKLEAVIDYMKVKTVGEMVELAKSLDHFFFVAGISDAEQYGKHMIIESGHFEYDSELESYIEFEKYGQDCLKNEKGCFTSYGYICHTSSMEEVCELNEHQEENMQRMGGM
ncbi:antirestriction protein ArdA [Anaerosolibacter sp.]|uniref:antirestriction protein ArdA n=1 Tax=Anaerosolibacter sp. TaxID=1872527 RepID=UPI0039EEE88F